MCVASQKKSITTSHCYSEYKNKNKKVYQTVDDGTKREKEKRAMPENEGDYNQLILKGDRVCTVKEASGIEVKLEAFSIAEWNENQLSKRMFLFLRFLSFAICVHFISTSIVVHLAFAINRAQCP
jgi:hypothetical protein